MVKHPNRVATGAHYGLRDWLLQRITAVVMVVYVVLLTGLISVQGISDHAELKLLFAQQWFRIATFLFFLSLSWHAWVGVRNVLMDYIHATGIRLSLHVAVIILLLVYLVWFAEILWG